MWPVQLNSRGSSPPPMAAWWSTINNIIVSREAILSTESSGNLWAVGALPRTPLGELTALPQPPHPSWWGIATPPRSRYSASIFTYGIQFFPQWTWARPWVSRWYSKENSAGNAVINKKRCEFCAGRVSDVNSGRRWLWTSRFSGW